jgi:hypothetical protein
MVNLLLEMNLVGERGPSLDGRREPTRLEVIEERSPQMRNAISTLPLASWAPVK